MGALLRDMAILWKEVGTSPEVIGKLSKEVRVSHREVRSLEIEFPDSIGFFNITGVKSFKLGSYNKDIPNRLVKPK